MRGWPDDEIQRGLRDPARRKRAFWELHMRYGPKLLGLLVRMCHGDRDLAEDLLGRTLYKAFQGLVRMDTPCRSLPAWLYTIAARTALDALAHRATHDPLHGSLPLNDDLALGDGHTSKQPPGERAGIIGEAVDLVLARLDAENPLYRTLLEMEHVGACDRAEIAEATGLPRKQIAQYLKRARQRFMRLARDHPALAELQPTPDERTPQ